MDEAVKEAEPGDWGGKGRDDVISELYAATSITAPHELRSRSKRTCTTGRKRLSHATPQPDEKMTRCTGTRQPGSFVGNRIPDLNSYEKSAPRN